MDATRSRSPEIVASEELLTPSEMLQSLRRVGRETWMRPEVSPESALSVAASIAQNVEEALPGADWSNVGSAIFAIGSQVALKDEAFAGQVCRAIPPAQVLLGVRRGAQLTCRVGDALIDRGEQATSTRSDRSAFEVDEAALADRSTLVHAAESVVPELLPNAELVAGFLDAIRGPADDPSRDGMVTKVAQALPGIDAAQAGWGLIFCGSNLLALADAAAPESKRRRRLPQRRPQQGADLLGSALVGAVDVIAGDAWIRSARGTASNGT
jgi:hypothetical protein